MNELDSRIQAALEAATELQDPILEPTLTEEFLESFQGTHGWLIMGGWLKTLAVLALMVFCVYQFFQQETVMGMLAYASLTVVCIVVHGAIMLFVWIQMNHNTTVREIKRLELQVAMLLKQLKEKSE